MGHRCSHRLFSRTNDHLNRRIAFYHFRTDHISHFRNGNLVNAHDEADRVLYLPGLNAGDRDGSALDEIWKLVRFRDIYPDHDFIQHLFQKNALNVNVLKYFLLLF